MLLAVILYRAALLEISVMEELPEGDNGANDWTRTSDPRFTKALLYQLSYVGLQL